MYTEIYLLRQSHMGFATARNNGVMMASHEWVAFLNAEDTWHPKKLAFQIAHHKKNPDSLVSCTEEMWIRSGKEWPRPQKSKKLVSEGILGHTDIVLSSVLINKAYFEDLGGFNEAMKDGEDKDIWLRILNEKKIHLLPQKLINRHF